MGNKGQRSRTHIFRQDVDLSANAATDWSKGSCSLVDLPAWGEVGGISSCSAHADGCRARSAAVASNGRLMPGARATSC